MAQGTPFANETLATLNKMSPTSLKARGPSLASILRYARQTLTVTAALHAQLFRPSSQITFHQLRQGRKLDFAAGFRMEYRLGQRVLVRSRHRSALP